MLHKTRLERLNLSTNLLGPRSLAALADALRVNVTLEALDLSSNLLCGVGFCGEDEAPVMTAAAPSTAEALARLCDALRSGGVSSLSLADNGLGPHATALLARGLAGNASLTSLRLDGNDMADAGAAELAAVLGETQIATLGLEANGIGLEGAAKLTAALPDATREPSWSRTWRSASPPPERPDLALGLDNDLAEAGASALAAAGVESLAAALKTSKAPKASWAQTAAKTRGVGLFSPRKVAPCGGVPMWNGMDPSTPGRKAQGVGARGRTPKSARGRAHPWVQASVPRGPYT